MFGTNIIGQQAPSTDYYQNNGKENLVIIGTSGQFSVTLSVGTPNQFTIL